jgi:oligopeptide transport system ATP-binding protein
MDRPHPSLLRGQLHRQSRNFQKIAHGHLMGALILRPKLIVADEPVSALDVSVGAQVLRLLEELQNEFALTYVFISHSLPVVAQLATRIAVMRAGKFVEVGPAEEVLRKPSSGYTRELLAAVPEMPRAGLV